MPPASSQGARADQPVFNAPPLVPLVYRSWEPSREGEGSTQTMVYGKGTPTPTPPLSELAYQQAREESPWMLPDDPHIKKRAKEIETQILKDTKA